jgi:hypothetical protein
MQSPAAVAEPQQACSSSSSSNSKKDTARQQQQQQGKTNDQNVPSAESLRYLSAELLRDVCKKGCQRTIAAACLVLPVLCCSWESSNTIGTAAVPALSQHPLLLRHV